MAHYAELSDESIVQRVLVTDNSWTEEYTIYWLQSNVSRNRWLRTSYNANIRGKFAGTGDYYDPIKDEFINTQAPTEPEPLIQNGENV